MSGLGAWGVERGGLMAILLLIYLLGFAGFIAAAIAATFGASQTRKSEIKNQKSKMQKGAPMKSRIVLVAILAIVATALLSGCSTLGNGQLDLPYDVDFALVLPNGDKLVVATDAAGVHLSGQYRSPRTGILYVGDPNGTITATDALGNAVSLTPRNQAPSTTDQAPSTTDQAPGTKHQAPETP